MKNPNNGNQLDQAAIRQIVLASLEEVLALNMAEPAGDRDHGDGSVLIGPGAVLDSLGLVSLILEVEQRLDQEFDVQLVLADERAMSQRHSPYRSIGSLVEYITRLVEEHNDRDRS